MERPSGQHFYLTIGRCVKAKNVAGTQIVFPPNLGLDYVLIIVQGKKWPLKLA